MDSDLRWSSGWHILFHEIWPELDDAVAYALAFCVSPTDRDIMLHLGSDDGIKVWINDKMVFSKSIVRSAAPGEDIVPASLNKGLNRILVRVDDQKKSWGMFFSIRDRSGNLPDDLIFKDMTPDKGLLAHVPNATGKKYVRFRVPRNLSRGQGTVSAWVRLAKVETGATASPLVATQDVSLGLGENRILKFRLNTLGPRGYELLHKAEAHGTSRELVAGTALPDTGAWHHIAATWNTDSRRMRVYLDAQEIGKLDAKAEGPQWRRSLQQVRCVMVGNRRAGKDHPVVKHVKVFAGEFSPQEIAVLHSMGSVLLSR